MLRVSIRLVYDTIYEINSQVLINSNDTYQIEYTTHYMPNCTLVLAQILIVLFKPSKIVLEIS